MVSISAGLISAGPIRGSDDQAEENVSCGEESGKVSSGQHEENAKENDAEIEKMICDS